VAVRAPFCGGGVCIPGYTPTPAPGGFAAPAGCALVVRVRGAAYSEGAPSVCTLRDNLI
jgi:hypothetical protein